MLSGYSFRPRLWAAVLAGAACAAGIALGNWQSQRADEKRALGAQLDEEMRSSPIPLSSRMVAPHEVALKHIVATGTFVPEHTVYLDNKLRRGRPGYEIVTPLKLDGVHVLVNRGWVAAGRTRGELPQVPTPAGPVRIEGLALERLPHVLEASPTTGAKLRQNIDIESFAQETGLRLQPIVIEQRSPAADGLARDWPRPDAGIEKHEAYSLQWYSLAGLALALFIVLSFQRVRPS
ncbi:MAG: SURF1 family protein [Betaproteobacteria bacterium]|nr:MAG: SURF1 family protein [Betaproteobacteria bacterium]